MKKEQTVFEIGDKVFCCIFGWGNIVKFNKYEQFPIVVKFPSKTATYTFDGRYWTDGLVTLSFTEYKLEGFTQERPEVLPNKGDIVWVKDYEHRPWLISHFIKKIGPIYMTSDSSNEDDYLTSWEYMTTENPYVNEHRNEN